MLECSIAHKNKFNEIKIAFKILIYLKIRKNLTKIKISKINGKLTSILITHFKIQAFKFIGKVNSPQN